MQKKPLNLKQNFNNCVFVFITAIFIFGCQTSSSVQHEALKTNRTQITPKRTHYETSIGKLKPQFRIVGGSRINLDGNSVSIMEGYFFSINLVPCLYKT